MNELDRMMFTDYFPYKPETGVLSLREGSSEQLTQYKHPSLDVKEENDEIKISVDLPGVEKEAIKLRLVNPRLLELSCEKKSEFEDKKDNYYIKERAYGYIKRMIALPSDVTELGMKSEFKNGVLDLKFNKIEITKKEYLRLE
jgi:HSP20 family protein